MGIHADQSQCSGSDESESEVERKSDIKQHEPAKRSDSSCAKWTPILCLTALICVNVLGPHLSRESDLIDFAWVVRSWLIFGRLPVASIIWLPIGTSYPDLMYFVMLCLATSHADTKRLQFTRYAGYVWVCGLIYSMYREHQYPQNKLLDWALLVRLPVPTWLLLVGYEKIVSLQNCLICRHCELFT